MSKPKGSCADQAGGRAHAVSRFRAHDLPLENLSWHALASQCPEHFHPELLRNVGENNRYRLSEAGSCAPAFGCPAPFSLRPATTTPRMRDVGAANQPVLRYRESPARLALSRPDPSYHTVVLLGPSNTVTHASK